MRTLTDHQVNGCNEQLRIDVMDGPGPGGASHCYRITGFDSTTNPSCPWRKLHGAGGRHAHVLFQHGPVGQAGVNGVTQEALLAILIDRLRGFQAGDHACDENRAALEHLEAARDVLHQRTRRRGARGVEGTHAQ